MVIMTTMKMMMDVKKEMSAFQEIWRQNFK